MGFQRGPGRAGVRILVGDADGAVVGMLDGGRDGGLAGGVAHHVIGGVRCCRFRRGVRRRELRIARVRPRLRLGSAIGLCFCLVASRFVLGWASVADVDHGDLLGGAWGSSTRRNPSR